ncbi:MAG: hypothetical protein D6795_10765 [Deltaproteobacteria bacterium]|nr:MAG: hypothetical protein D6795_10765 [Deltaproteobacteria bacterium]
MYFWRRYLIVGGLLLLLGGGGMLYWKRAEITDALFRTVKRVGRHRTPDTPAEGSEHEGTAKRERKRYTPIPVEPPSAAGAPVEVLRKASLEMIERLAPITWARAIGKEQDPSTPLVDDSPLFSKKWLAALEAGIAEETDPRRKRALEYLHHDLLRRHIAASVADLDRKIREIAQRPAVVLGEERLNLDTAFARLVEEEDAAARKEIAQAMVPVIERMNPLFEERIARKEKAAHALGYPNYLALAESIGMHDFARLSKQASEILDRTRSLYVELLAETASHELSLPLPALSRHDFPRMLSLPRFKDAFPRERLLPSLRGVLAGLGEDVAGKPIVLDIADRAGKGARALTVPVKIPTDIRVSLKPLGGYLDYAALFHEWGHALHYAFSEDEFFEFAYLGPASVREAYAFVFERIAASDPFLEHHLEIPEATRRIIRRELAWAHLYLLRRYAAKFLFEVMRYQNDMTPEEAAERYREFLSDACGVLLDESDGMWYLKDGDDDFAAADYLEGWILAGQIENFLVYNFGDAWFERPGGGYLMGFWFRKNEPTAQEVSAQTGEEALTPERLLQRIEAMLHPPIPAPE